MFWSAALSLMVAFGVVPNIPAATAADLCAVPVQNPIACENSKPGNPASQWDVSGSGSASIQGFATDISVNLGDRIGFKVDTIALSFRIDIYRLGFYGGSGARSIATVSSTVARKQPTCLSDSTTGLIDCGNWSESGSWSVPADAVSGVYIAALVRTDGTAGASHVVFVVRDDASTSTLLFQTSDSTWQAYNKYGGNSLYTGSPAGRAYKVSYNRPVTTRGTGAEDAVFNAEYPMIRWIEANGYNVSYTSDVDSDRRGGLIRNHKAFLSVGHDEYWSGTQRAQVEAARNAGVHLAFFSGNEVFWKTRWESSIDGSGTTYRTLVSYKETKANAKIDPSSTWTGTWRDPRFSPPADGGRPENALTGTSFTVNCCVTQMTVSGAFRNLRFWRNTRVAALAETATTQLGTNTLGYEWDTDPDNGARPAGLVPMSSTTVNGMAVIQDYGSTYATGTATHSLTLYRAASGALVFGAGSVQWSWGLDGTHDKGASTPDTAMGQATVNLLADMGAQPSTIRSGLSAASASTDTTPPTSVISSPAAGSVPAGTTISVSGTAADVGGVVGAVEVSTDNGSSWHRATGTSSWSYSWRTPASGSVTILSRASDDSGWVQSPPTSRAVTIGSTAPVSCPCSLWSASTVPTVITDSDRSAVELGVRFRSDVAGFISGIRFYKGPSNTGTHLGRLWTTGGTQLASASFSAETASGWQQVNFAAPVAVTAGTTYIASYYAPVAAYSADTAFFAVAGVDQGPLHAPKDASGSANGVYRYGTGGGFPTSTYKSTNYWIDVVFTG